jgi:flagellar protein FlbD
MIQLTRLNNARFAVNSDLIKYVEEAPDTVLTLVGGEKLVVRESTEQVIERVRDFRRSILSDTGQTSATIQPAHPTAAGSACSACADAEEPHRG